MRKKAIKYTGYIENTWPGLIEMMNGIAEGAKVKYEDILFLNAFSEICEGCTCWLSCSNISKSDKTFICMDVDESRQVKETQIILDVKPENGYRYAGITYAGLIAPNNGITENGIGFTVMLLITQKNNTETIANIPLYPLVYNVLTSAKTAKEAADLFETHSPGIGTPSNIFFADKSNAYRLENVPDISAKMEITNGVAFCAMRPQTEEIIPYDNAEHVSKMIEMNAIDRDRRMQSLMYDHNAVFSLEYMLKIASDHGDKSGKGPCQHSLFGADTVSSFIGIPEEKLFYYCLGHPCKNKFEKYSL